MFTARVGVTANEVITICSQTHTPETHSLPEGQTVPQVPQLFTSVALFTSLPPGHVASGKSHPGMSRGRPLELPFAETTAAVPKVRTGRPLFAGSLPRIAQMIVRGSAGSKLDRSFLRETLVRGSTLGPAEEYKSTPTVG